MQSRHKHRIFDALKKSKASSNSKTSSTFTKTNSNSSILELDNSLHSKSTYFYRWCNKNNSRLVSMCVLALLVGLGANLLISNNTYADTLSVTFPADAGTDINPSDSTSTNVTVGEVVYRKYKFNVGYEDLLSNTYYHVSVSTDDSHNGNLYNEVRPSFQITGVGSDVLASNTAAFKDNTWGYNLTRNNTAALDTLSYSTVPFINTGAITFRTNGSRGDNDMVSGTDPFDLTFAAKFSNDAPSGNYTAQVYLSIVMDPSNAVFGGIETMQEMNSDICKDTVEGNSKRLEDTRDRKDGVVGTGTFYWVTKLKDGNCWMTQNLAYDGGGTSRDIKNWPYRDYSSSCYNNEAKDYYYVGGNPQFGQTGAEAEGDNPNGFCADTNKPSDCVTSGHLSKTAPSVNGDTALGEHYKIGNYYTYNAAQNVCPANWQLPTSNSLTTDGSFGNLIAQYGHFEGDIIDAASIGAYEDPFYFVYSGRLEPGILRHIGAYGAWHSSTTYSNSQAYYLSLHDRLVPSSLSLDKSIGISVRCVYIPTK